MSEIAVWGGDAPEKDYTPAQPVVFVDGRFVPEREPAPEPDSPGVADARKRLSEAEAGVEELEGLSAPRDRETILDLLHARETVTAREEELAHALTEERDAEEVATVRDLAARYERAAASLERETAELETRLQAVVEVAGTVHELRREAKTLRSQVVGRSELSPLPEPLALRTETVRLGRGAPSHALNRARTALMGEL